MRLNFKLICSSLPPRPENRARKPAPESHTFVDHNPWVSGVTEAPLVFAAPDIGAQHGYFDRDGGNEPPINPTDVTTGDTAKKKITAISDDETPPGRSIPKDSIWK